MDYAEGRVHARGMQLRYVQAGEGEPLVWLHGGGGLHPSAGTDLLTRSFHVVAFELPGFGSSLEQDGAKSFDELSEQVAGGIQALGLSEYVLHGTSFGGATALHIALNHPDRVTRLILESPAAFRPPEELGPAGPRDHAARALPPSQPCASRAHRPRGDAEAARARRSPVPDGRPAGAGRPSTRPLRARARDVRRLRPFDASCVGPAVLRERARLLVCAHRRRRTRDRSDQPDAYATTVHEFALSGRVSARPASP